MYIKIGPYRYAPFPTHEWERRYLTWRHGDEEYRNTALYSNLDRAVIKILDVLTPITAPINNWWVSRPRKEKIRMDRYDTWNMDHTLALIISPMLRQLRATTHGAPYVDDEDVPEELRSTAAPPKENEWDTDANHFLRWEWVLDEMIWAFEQHASDDDTAQFHHNTENSKVEFVDVVDSDCRELKIVTIDPSKPAAYYDLEGHRAHEDRKRKAFMLFGKYYSSMWD
jgi:hypothetical protein